MVTVSRHRIMEKRGVRHVSATVYFDLDGTLCRPRAAFDGIFFTSCAPLLEACPRIDQLQLLHAWEATLQEPGPSMSAGCLARALRACGSAAPDDLVEQCAQSLNQEWARAQELNVGAKDLLGDLKRNGVRLGMITNGPSDGQRAVVSALGLEDWFRWIVVSGDAEVGVRKPEAGIFHYALDASRSEAHETWYVGDSAINDILGASRAGLRTCWLCSPHTVCPDGVPEPTARIATLVELLEVLAR